MTMNRSEYEAEEEQIRKRAEPDTPAPQKQLPAPPEAELQALQRLLGNATVGRLLTGRAEAARHDAAVEPVTSVPGETERRIDAEAGQGEPLPPGVREEMEAFFGAALPDVRLHTDATAVDLAEGLSARAFTHGKDVYFADPSFDPASKDGRETLVHELTHVLHQATTGKEGIQRQEAATAEEARDEEAAEPVTAVQALWETSVILQLKEAADMLRQKKPNVRAALDAVMRAHKAVRSLVEAYKAQGQVDLARRLMQLDSALLVTWAEMEPHLGILEPITNIVDGLEVRTSVATSIKAELK
jgi:hypothetical protein